MIVQAPNPERAIVIPTAVPNSVEAISRISRLRKFISRLRSAVWVLPSADKNVSKDATAKSGVTEGIEKNAPATGARATPTNVITAPAARVVQKTVERSASVMTDRWISADPSERSVKIQARLVKTRAIAARPNSCGVRRCASTIPTIVREPCAMI